MNLINNVSADKLRGGFYTPDLISSFIVNWALDGKSKYDVLEPSCGDGSFLRAVKRENGEYNSLKALEFLDVEAEKANKINLDNCNVINGDFLKYSNTTKDKFDVVIGNPPYIRYQYLSKEQQLESSRVFERVGIKHSKLTNIWVTFVIASSLLLKEKGKIAFVLPAEILQVSYAKPLREFLTKCFNKISIVSFKKLVFEKIQQEVVLLLCEKNGDNNDHLIDHIEVNDAKCLGDIDMHKLTHPQKKLDFNSNKWTYYFLEQKEIDFLEDINKNNILPKIKNYADIQIGITTGANKYFSVPHSIVEEYDLFEYAKKLVGRSVQVPSATFINEDWEMNKDDEKRSYLLEFPKRDTIKNKKVLEYLDYGMKEKIHKGYKCSIRDEWQIIPSLWIPEALFLRRSNLYPKLVRNDVKAYTTDTMHRVKLHDKTQLNAFIGSYYNSLSLAFTEISGRSHGGGVLELMPSEAESIILPFHDSNSDLIEKIDKMLREKKSIENILNETNPQVLKKNYGFSTEEIKLSESIRRKLMLRRLHRN